MELHASAAGALFETGEPLQYALKLENVSSAAQPYQFSLQAGEGAARELSGEIPPGETISQTIELPELPPGLHEVSATLTPGAGGATLTRVKTLGVVPAYAFKHRDDSPLGTATFAGRHFTPTDLEATGKAFTRIGLRYGLDDLPYEMRRKLGARPRKEVVVKLHNKPLANLPERWAQENKENPDLLQGLLVFHEDSISPEHATRVPDIFTDRPPYALNEAEKKRFEEMTALATDAAKLFRAKHPEVKIHLGNGGLTLREEFYRAKFPAELFDTAGNENASFMRPPETQPPDFIANNASLWMDRQLLDAYGYKDKPVSQCHETIYPSSNPGSLTRQAQGDYMVRNVLHSLAWGMPLIRPGGLVDFGDSYHYGNWGAIGMFTRGPDFTPKPAGIAMANLTRVLDGARYAGFLDTGSGSAYLLRFGKSGRRQRRGGVDLPRRAGSRGENRGRGERAAGHLGRQNVGAESGGWERHRAAHAAAQLPGTRDRREDRFRRRASAAGRQRAHRGSDRTRAARCAGRLENG